MEFKDFRVRGYGIFNEAFREWRAGDRNPTVEHIRPVLAGVTSILTEYIKEFDFRPEDVRWREGDHGTLGYSERLPNSRQTRDVESGWGLVWRVDRAYLILTTVPMDKIRTHETRLTWCLKGNACNCYRRLEVMRELMVQPPWILQPIASRYYDTYPRSEDECKRVRDSEVIDWIRKRAHPDQLKVIIHAPTQRGIVMARGPYGCGKTTLITLMVLAYCKLFPDKQIAITSETNAAIDEDLERLIDRKCASVDEVIRLGVPMRDEPFVPSRRLRKCYLKIYLQDFEDDLQGTVTGKGARGTIRSMLDNEEERILRRTPIVVATLVQLGKPEYRHTQFSLIINDEGAQTIEASLLQSIRAQTETTVLAGELKQLLPFAAIADHEKARFKDGERRHKLTWSLMHAMEHITIQDAGKVVFPGLTMTAEYRSHPHITAFLAPFYDYALEDLAVKSANYLHDMLLPSATSNSFFNRTTENTWRGRPWVNEERVFWISPTHTISEAQRNAKNKRPKDRTDEEANRENYVQAVIVFELLWRIRWALRRRQQEERTRQSGFSRQDRDTPRKRVLVITPYRAHRRMLRHLLNGDFMGEAEDVMTLDVRTVDSSQGKEADITVVAMVRNDELGFMVNYAPRALVALSRGRDYLFIVACHQVFAKEDIWRWLMENADEQKIPSLAMDWDTEVAETREDVWRQRVRAKYLDEDDAFYKDAMKTADVLPAATVATVRQGQAGAR